MVTPKTVSQADPAVDPPANADLPVDPPAGANPAVNPSANAGLPLSSERPRVVLDGSVLLHDPGALEAFPRADVIVSLTVLEHLDRFQGERSESGRHARLVTARLDAYRQRGDLARGVRLAHGGSLRVVTPPWEMPAVLRPLELHPARARLLATALQLQRRETREVVLVSRDASMRIRAAALGLQTRGHTHAAIPAAEAGYRGYKLLSVPRAAWLDIEQRTTLRREDPLLRPLFGAADGPSSALGDALPPDDAASGGATSRSAASRDVASGSRLEEEFSPHEGLLLRVSPAEASPAEATPAETAPAETTSAEVTPAEADPAEADPAAVPVARTKELSACQVWRYDAPRRRLMPVRGSAAGVDSIRPRNPEQRLALELLLHPQIPLVTLEGKAGTGKTLLALAAGLCSITERKQYRKMLVSRPIFPMGKDLGYLPGTAQEKLGPWMQPIFDNLDVLMGRPETADHPLKGYLPLIERGLLAIEPLTYIRGRSVAGEFMVIDEAQNLTPHEMKTIVTRVGEGTKLVLTGDAQQIDNPELDSYSNGLSHLIRSFREQGMAAHVRLTRGERSSLAELAANIL